MNTEYTSPFNFSKEGKLKMIKDFENTLKNLNLELNNIFDQIKVQDFKEIVDEDHFESRECRDNAASLYGSAISRLSEQLKYFHCLKIDTNSSFREYRNHNEESLDCYLTDTLKCIHLTKMMISGLSSALND